MKKSFYSAAAAGLLLLAGTGAASAVPLIGVSSTSIDLRLGGNHV